MRKICANTFKDIVIHQIKEHGALFAGMQLVIILNSLTIGIAYTEIIRRTTDAIWTKDHKGLWETLLLFALLVAAAFLLGIAKRKWMFVFQKHFVYAMEDGIYVNYSAEEYWTKAGQDKVLGHIRKVVPDAVGQLINQIDMTWGIAIVIISGCLYGISISPVILLSSVLVTCALAAFNRESNGKISDLYQEFTENNSAMYNLLWEQVKNREMAGFLDKDKVLEGYDRKSRDYLTNLLRIKKATNGAGLFSQFGSMIAIVQVSLVGGWLVFQGRLRFADLLAMIMLIQTIASYIFQVPVMVQGFKKLKGYRKDMDMLLGQQQNAYKKEEKIQRLPLKSKIHEIKLQGVSFTYPSSEETVVQGIELSLSERNFYAVAGESGCGKTTLLRLIARLVPGWLGDIWIDSRRLDSVDRDSYWSHLALVEQMPALLPERTLLYNITLNEMGYDEMRLQRIIRDTMLDEYLDQRPEGIMTIVSEKKLSKGEIKKVNIARAMYRNADLFLLDEMTEGLDIQAERSILQALKRIAKEGAIVVCISHKPETLQMADKVIFMREGNVEGIAPHEEWMAKNEAYQRLMGGNGL